MSKNPKYVTLEVTRSGGRHESSDEPYGDWYSDNGSASIKKIVDNGYGEQAMLIDGLELEAGKPYFIVRVMYSSGNTFGHEVNCFEGICVTDKYERAAEIKKLIEDDYQNQDRKSDSYYLEIGGDQQIYTGTWKGYFESLDDVDIEVAPYMP